MTVDRSTLTVDLAPHVSDTESLDPPVGIDDVADVMLTSAGPHLSARNRDADVMLMLASYVDQPQRDTCQPRINSAFSHFQK